MHRQVKISEDREILVRGKTRFMGYVQENGLIEPFDKYGWFATGDLGDLVDGCLRIQGRKDNMFISGGENIQPEEIEKAICQVAGIQEAVVVPVRDSLFGFRPVAYCNGEFDPVKLAVTLRKTLAGYKIPVIFYDWPAGNQYFSGIKINRIAFKKRAEQDSSR